MPHKCWNAQRFCLSNKQTWKRNCELRDKLYWPLEVETQQKIYSQAISHDARVNINEFEPVFCVSISCHFD